LNRGKRRNVRYKAILCTHCLAGRGFYVLNNRGIKILLPNGGFGVDRFCCQMGVLVWMLISFSFVSILLFILDQKSSSWILGNDMKTVQGIS
jgi:hypothetical protein